MKNMSVTEIFQEISKRQILALMFHDSMYDLYSFLNLPGFKQWHKYQYIEESKEFLETKQYFVDVHNRLLDLDSPGQPKLVVPDSWYDGTRFDVTSQIMKQYIESSFNNYRIWEEESCSIYEACAKELLDMGNVSDYAWVSKLIEDVKTELKEIYKYMLKLRATNYDMPYIMEIQGKLSKQYTIQK